MNPGPSSSISRKAALAKLKQLMNQRIGLEQGLREIWGFAWANDGSPHQDRMIALAVGSLVEEGLQSILTQFFVPLEPTEEAKLFADDRGTLSSFAARVEIAYAIGLVGPDTRHDLTSIRYIRNAFAHIRTPLSFDSPEIARLCSDLVYPTLTGTLVRDLSGAMETNRDKFVETARVRWLSLMFPGQKPRAELLSPEKTFLD